MSDLISREAALAELERHAKGTTTIGGQTFRTIQLAEATAAIAALPAATVRVRKLEWVGRYSKHDGGKEHFGTGVFGHWYGVKRENNGEWRVAHHIGVQMVEVGYYPSLEAAKAAAKADYEARVRSAIE